MARDPHAGAATHSRLRSFNQLLAAAQLIDALAQHFSASDLRPAELLRGLEVASKMHNQLEAVRAVLASAVTDTKAWQGGRHRSAAELIGRTTGTSNREATELIETGARLKDHPATDKAVRRGELSGSQAHEVTQGAAANPRAEQRLLDAARHGSLGDLKDERRRVEAAADPDPEATRRRIHERRSLRTYAEPDGSWHLHLSHTTATGARVMGALRPHIDAAFEEARREGRYESPEAYGADGLVTALCGAEEGGDGPKVSGRPKYIVRIDHEALRRGQAKSDEVCEIAGVGPVSVSAVKELALEDDPFWVAIVAKGRDVFNVAHLGRQPNAHQLTALQWLFPACAVLGCNQTVRIQWDHREDWRQTHQTSLPDLDGLCAFHHRLKTNQGWMLVEGSETKRAFVPPQDPRHPKLRRPARAPDAPPSGRRRADGAHPPREGGSVPGGRSRATARAPTPG